MPPPDNLPDSAFWLALVRAPGIGPATAGVLLDRFSSPRRLFAARAREFSAAGLPDPVREAIGSTDWDAVARDLEWLAEDHNYIVTRQDAAYPPLLQETAGAPPVLFVHGNPALLSSLQLAMVGSRNPTPAGLQNARDFAAHLAGSGLSITSGLALGIDGASHEGALQAGGITIAVTGTGLDRVYPSRHRELAHEIARSGALVSEFPPGTGPLPDHFPRRNRIISGMSLGTLVVEAALRSGSLITARQAAEQGREVFAIPGSIHNPLARGCHALIRQGAKLVETAEDVLTELGPLAGAVPVRTGNPAAKDPEEGVMDPDHRRVLEYMGHDPSPVDALVTATGLTAEAVSSILLILELQGHVASSPGGIYSRVQK